MNPIPTPALDDRLGWIEWHGGECPVSPETRVDVRWNNNAVSHNMNADLLSGNEHLPNLWVSRGKGGHIIAYRIVRDRP